MRSIVYLHMRVTIHKEMYLATSLTDQCRSCKADLAKINLVSYFFFISFLFYYLLVSCLIMYQFQSIIIWVIYPFKIVDYRHCHYETDSSLDRQWHRQVSIFWYSGETNFRHKIVINTDLNWPKVFRTFQLITF